jgi:deoxyadenosine/deoxycytidine kinase
MTIIQIEGASAVGKTTTSSALALKYDGYHIPEVNTWWKRPEHEYPEWFFERQLDRFRIAQEKSRDHRFVVIDIDLFQPFWYNWAFGFTLFGGQSLDFITDYYRNQLLARKIGFPDKYYLLNINEAELRRRKEGDTTRGRRGFEMHLTFIEPQRHYFEALNSFIPGLVSFIESVSVEDNVKQIVETMPSKPQEHTYSTELFDFMTSWLRENKASDFLKG